MSNYDQVKYRLGLVNIGLDRLESVNIGLDRLILVWIGYYWSRLVNISLNGLNVKKKSVDIGKDWLILAKMLIDAYRF